MATLTNEQIEAKKRQLQQLTEQAKAIEEELKEAGALPMDEEDLDNVAGGGRGEWVWSHRDPTLPHGVV